MKTITINNELKTILSQIEFQLKKHYGQKLFQLVLFGSQAREDARPDSDIDILIVLNETVNPGEEIKQTGKMIADLSLENDVVISRLFMDKEQFINGSEPLLRNIRKEGITL
ncbi:MAG: nucleotidyltransferase [Anabaena sp. CRKS33]|jgi:predicted nucleotidyltransferase|nr:MAG: nucleotidyltransferase [Anabaena sp. CRKS33]